MTRYRMTTTKERKAFEKKSAEDAARKERIDARNERYVRATERHAVAVEQQTAMMAAFGKLLLSKLQAMEKEKKKKKRWTGFVSRPSRRRKGLRMRPDKKLRMRRDAFGPRRRR